jgi:hemerythrin-like metal-binding protein
MPALRSDADLNAARMPPDTITPWPRTGHAEMDRQHDHLQHLIAQVYAGIAAQSPSITRAAIAAFAQGASDHFAFEADLMVSTNFPGAREHLSDHRAIAVGVLQLVEALDAGQPPRATMDTTLTVWQAHHVGGMDQALARHVLASEVADDFAG